MLWIGNSCLKDLRTLRYAGRRSMRQINEVLDKAIAEALDEQQLQDEKVLFNVFKFIYLFM